MATHAPSSTSSLLRRTWTGSERRVVLEGVLGRVLVAIEPSICFVVFAALTVSLIFLPLPAAAKLTRFESAVVIAPIFGLATVAALLWLVLVLVAPLRALLQTFSPIYIVDGYVRYRRPDPKTEADSNGYVAVLDESHDDIVEWPSLGNTPLPDSLRPAMVEFSFFGGIHRIDGKSTGVVPERIALAGVGMSRRRAE